MTVVPKFRLLFDYLSITMSNSFYAVAKGRQMGIYHSWLDCEKMVKGFPGAKFKKFSEQSEARRFIMENASADNKKSTSEVNNQQNTKITCNNNDEKLQMLIRRAKENKLSQQKQGIKRLSKLPENVIEKRRRVEIATPTKNYSVLKPDSQNSETVLLPFEVDDKDFVIVYTDGACLNNGRKKPQAGVGVWFGDNHPLNISKPAVGPNTNNTAEIQAARLAIEIAAKAGLPKLRINTDSNFLIQCATQWMCRWKKNGWKLSNGGEVKNRLELEKLDLAMKRVTVEWTKVPAHTGIHGNEMADKLANAGATKAFM